MMARDHLHGVLAVLFASVVWGTTGTAATLAPEVSAAAIGAAAMGVGGLMQAAIAGRGLARAWPQLRAHWGLLLIGGLSVAIYPLAFYGSMRLAGVTIGTVITLGSAPLLSALLEYVIDGARLSLRWLMGAVIGLAGMVLLCLAEMNGHGTGGQVLPGTALGLVGGLTYAAYSWAARGLMMGGIRSRTAMGAVFGIGGLLLMPVLIATGAPFLQSAVNLSVGVYMAVVPMFLGYVAFGYGLARVSASTATTITLTEPVVAAMLAIVIVGERLQVMGWLGVGLILACLVVITMPRRRAPRFTSPEPASQP
ncbi:DMT family transporter [Paracoccus sp. (in: a-proteobacteria)]|uniref:DMT family transporter n=1 Tax=Paracoccus sp. TaxID=267 RepID=UPI0026DF0548|nr:EamA family transporter [Paracoccus sp. (in: a-proteobacteria)]MDO5648747.1 EamA family transporter [Paracoccus sp. (in: a-proteobacteria)]